MEANFSEEEFTALVEAAADFSDYRSGEYFTKHNPPLPAGASALRLHDPSRVPPWAKEIREMFITLARFQFSSGRGRSLEILCEAGARYGLQQLEASLSPGLLALVSPKAKARLKRDLQRVLERVTEPCLKLEKASYKLALASIGAAPKRDDSNVVERKFLGEQPGGRLFSLFKKFPVLPRLWSLLIFQWREYVRELLIRLAADRTALSRALLGRKPVGRIVDLRSGLSDRHNNGRSVAMLEFEAGSVIYKPRPGDGEWEWHSLLEWMNTQSFRPRLRAGRVIRRKHYCWMANIEAGPCRNRAGARRFYERIGGLIAAAYLLKAVDCHRDNLIASGEDPVLVDADALWHVSVPHKGLSPHELLNRTGFFPASNPQSLQSRSSALGGSGKGPHRPGIGRHLLRPESFEHEIVTGFRKGWHSILGTKGRRRAFARCIRRLQARPRRRIHWPTERYGAIKEAALQPAALRSGIERDLLLARLCSRKGLPPAVIHAEVEALKRFDIPYFTSRRKEAGLSFRAIVPREVIEALRRCLNP